jgi:hypothetical protein
MKEGGQSQWLHTSPDGRTPLLADGNPIPALGLDVWQIANGTRSRLSGKA